jgi:hypothetical protein
MMNSKAASSGHNIVPIGGTATEFSTLIGTISCQLLAAFEFIINVSTYRNRSSTYWNRSSTCWNRSSTCWNRSSIYDRYSSNSVAADVIWPCNPLPSVYTRNAGDLWPLSWRRIASFFDAAISIWGRRCQRAMMYSWRCSRWARLPTCVSSHSRLRCPGVLRVLAC